MRAVRRRGSIVWQQRSGNETRDTVYQKWHYPRTETIDSRDGITVKLSYGHHCCFFGFSGDSMNEFGSCACPIYFVRVYLPEIGANGKGVLITVST